MKTSTASVLALLVLAVGGTAAWWLLRDPPDPAGVQVANEEPVVEEMDPQRKRAAEHKDAWPFGAFQDEMDALRGRGDPVTASEPERIRLEKENTLKAKTFDLHVKDVPLDELVSILSEKTKDTGVKVFTYPTGDDVALFRFTYDAEETDVFTVIGAIMAKSDMDVRYFTTWEGVCIGSERAVQQSQIDARESLARKRAEVDRKNPLLNATFRPDFDRAYLGPIAEAIKAQTGVEVIVDAQSWAKFRTLTWRADPMPLRDALDRISHRMGFVYRVKDGRVFVLTP